MKPAHASIKRPSAHCIVKARTAKPIMIAVMPTRKITPKRESSRGASGTRKTRRWFVLARVATPRELSEMSFMTGPRTKHRIETGFATATRECGPLSEMGLVSRVSPVHTVLRNCTRDEGRSFEVGNQVLISSHRKLLSSKAMVVNVAETSGLDSGRQGLERRAQANRC